MSPENERKLFDAYPDLSRARSSPEDYPIKNGFQCYDGWFKLLFDLSAKIENQARLENLNTFDDAWPMVTQVKEKMGSLRFHIRNRSYAMYELVQRALEESTHICEICGHPGTLCRGETVCDDHAD